MSDKAKLLCVYLTVFLLGMCHASGLARHGVVVKPKAPPTPEMQSITSQIQALDARIKPLEVRVAAYSQIAYIKREGKQSDGLEQGQIRAIKQQLDPMRQRRIELSRKLEIKRIEQSLK